MSLIDSDAHVVETPQTWEYVEPSERRVMPRLVSPGDEPGSEYWLIDGKIRGLARRVITASGLAELSRQAGRNMDTPREAREMENVAARFHHMDAGNLVIGTDYGHNGQSPEVEALRNLAESGGLSATQYRKIVDDNPRALWSL